MAKRFTRNIRSIKDIEKQPKYTNQQNDLLSDDKHVYVRNKDQYEQITGGVKEVNGETPDENGNVDLQIKDFKEQKKLVRKNQLDEALADIKINVKTFGAKGDGVTDDSNEIQKAIDYCFDNDLLKLYFPEGQYVISKPIVVKTKRDNGNVHWWDGKGIKLQGNDKATTKIIKTTTNTLTDYHEEVDGIDSTIILFAGINLDGSQGGSGTGIGIESLYIENQSTIEGSTAITGNASQRMILNDLNIKGYSGIVLDGAFSSVFSNLFIKATENALSVTGGGTSNKFEMIYTSHCHNPYIIKSAYSSIDLVYGDGCTGTVFEIGAMGLVAYTLGTESPLAQYIIKTEGTRGTQLLLESLFMHRQTGDSGNGITLDDCAVVISNRDVKIDNLYILEHQEITGNSYLYTAIDKYNTSTIDIGRVYYRKNYTGEDNPKLNLVKLHSNQNSRGKINFIGSSVNVKRNNRQPYLGMDKLEENFNNPFVNKGIFLDNETKYLDSIGTDNEWQQPYNLGDILLLNDPKEMNALAYVITDVGDKVRNCEFTEIPIVRRGTTEERPTTNLFVGLEYKDTTLKKTVTWYGSDWYDETGNIV